MQTLSGTRMVTVQRSVLLSLPGGNHPRPGKYPHSGDAVSSRARKLLCNGRAGFGNYLPGLPASFTAAASASRASSGSDLVPVFVMIEARWFSTVRWLIPRSTAMFLLG
jgi:hypothetical protein